MTSSSLRLVRDRLRPFALTSTRQVIAGTAVAIVVLGAIVWADRLVPGPGVATLTVIPVLGAVWLLPRLAAALVVALALADRIAAAALGEVGPVGLFSESLAILVIAGVGRVAATYVVATASAAGRAQLVARVARIATSADSIEKILDQILKEMAREGLRGGLVGLINEHNESHIQGTGLGLYLARELARDAQWRHHGRVSPGTGQPLHAFAAGGQARRAGSGPGRGALSRYR